MSFIFLAHLDIISSGNRSTSCTYASDIISKAVLIMKDVIYYDDFNTEFSGITKNTISIDKDFKFVHKNPIWKFFEFIVYRIIMHPIAFLWCKIKFGLKIVNRGALKKSKDCGYFIYSNHTLMAGDAFIPNVATNPKRTYVIVHPDNLSTKGTKNFIMMCGAIPVPSSFSAYRNFIDTVNLRIKQKSTVVIYPEAHIWPYYTGIRPFSSVSFSYPVKCAAPVYVSTTTFQKRKLGKTPRVTVYIDGPFFADTSLSPHDAEKELHDKVFETMKKRSENSTYERIKYVKKEV